MTALPIRQLTEHTEYIRRNGRHTLRMWTKDGSTLPFGQDRIILLWLVTLAIKQQSRIIHFDSPAELLDMFGMQKGGHEYRRLVEGFKRIYYTTMSFEEESRRGFSGTRMEFFSYMKVWFDSNKPDNQYTLGFQNTIVLGEMFWNEIKAHPIPVDLTIVKKLMDSPGNLDFYIWLVWRCWCARKPSAIPLTGPDGLMQQFGMSEATEPREGRRRIKHWLGITKGLWPECPAYIDEDMLVVSHSQAVESRSFPRDLAHAATPKSS